MLSCKNSGLYNYSKIETSTIPKKTKTIRKCDSAFQQRKHHQDRININSILQTDRFRRKCRLKVCLYKANEEESLIDSFFISVFESFVEISTQSYLQFFDTSHFTCLKISTYKLTILIDIHLILHMG